MATGSEPEYTWIAHTAIALATFLAVAVALFGDWLKSLWFKPKLELEFRNPRGVSQQAQVTDPGGRPRSVECRYYHLQVINRNRWPVATQVQVNLSRIEEPDAAGRLKVTWTGDIPLTWRFQEVHPVARSIGPEADCDFIAVAKGDTLSAQTMLVPFNFPLYGRKPPISGVVVTVQARSAEVDSPPKRFKISWDGNWAEGAEEMARHLVIEDITPLVVGLVTS